MILRADGGLAVHTLVLGDFLTNAYVLIGPGGTAFPGCDDARTGSKACATCWVVDPGLGVETLLDFLHRKDLAVARILLTHGHGDHIAGAGAVKAAFPQATLTAPAAEADKLGDPVHNLSGLFGFRLEVPPADAIVSPGDELTMGELAWRALDTSGHTVGGLSFYCPAGGVVITGDALFAGGIGRCDLPGGDERRLLANIRANLLTLPDATRVLPGHGPPTTVGRERTTNPFIRQ